MFRLMGWDARRQPMRYPDKARRQALGEPSLVQDRGDGTTLWNYASGGSDTDWRTYVPFANLGAHGDMQMQALTLVFDRRGVLESHTAMQSH